VFADAAPEVERDLQRDSKIVDPLATPILGGGFLCQFTLIGVFGV
jgi:hypothetical protein